MKMEVINLDDSARAYVENQLEWGHTLGRLLLANVQFSAGKFVTVAPVDRIQVTNFREAMFPPAAGGARTAVPGGSVQRVPSTANRVAPWIQRALTSTPGRLFVAELFFEDARRSRVAPAPANRVRFHGEHVYRAAAPSDSVDSVFQAVQSCSIVPQGCGVLATWPTDGRAWLEKALEFSLADLVQLSTNALVVLVGAFDGEGLVIWMCNDVCDALVNELPLGVLDGEAAPSSE